jgi:hypothetical protein
MFLTSYRDKAGTLTGSLAATSFAGNGSNLTNLKPATAEGPIGAAPFRPPRVRVSR